MYYDDDNDDNTLLGRLTELNRALSQMMRNTSERNIVEKLHTYQLAIKKNKLLAEFYLIILFMKIKFIVI